MADSELYDLAENKPLPVKPLHAKPPELSYATPPKRTDDFETKLRDFHAPLLLVVIGLSIELAYVWWTSRSYGNAARVIQSRCLFIVISTAVMCVTGFVAARMRAVPLGRWPNALLKFAAVTIAPTALGILLSIPLSYIPFFGFVLIFLVYVVAFFTLLGYLFDLDQEDTWYFVAVFFIVYVAIVIARAWLR